MKNYILLALCGALFWGLADIVTKKLLSSGVSNSTIVFFNSLVALLVAFPLFVRAFSTEQVKGSALFFLLLNGILVVAGLYLFYLAVEKGHVAVASAVMSTKILWTLLFSYLILKAPLSPLSVMGIVFVFAGLVLINAGGGK